MSAEEFVVRSKGLDANEAFQKAREDAFYWHGHSGYTGTIAEKESFTMLGCPDDMEVEDYIDELLRECDPIINDKWGPAGCIKDGDEYVFFGYASS